MPAFTRQRKQSFVRTLIFPAIATSVLGYFGFHALNGEFGLVGRARIELQVADLKSELSTVTREREELLARVMLLRSSSLDPDMVDERARLNLNLANEKEVVILR